MDNRLFRYHRLLHIRLLLQTGAQQLLQQRRRRCFWAEMAPSHSLR